MVKPVKTIFFGTPDFARPSLELLFKNPAINLVAVVTQPDQRAGRGQKLQATPLKILAQNYNLTVLQPKKINQAAFEQIKNYEPDLLVVVAYGLILPKILLELPKYGCLNLHPSLLPKYRGPCPIPAVILNGESETGHTVMLLDEKMDHGPILTQEKIFISADDTGQSLHNKLAQAGANLLNRTINDWLKQKIKPRAQNDLTATYCSLIKREDGQINWQKSAQEIDRQVRAFYPWPGSYTFYNKKRLKIISVKILNPDVSRNQAQAGLTFMTAANQLGITCGQGSLIIQKLQLEGKQEMTSENFLLGQPQIIGIKLG